MAPARISADLAPHRSCNYRGFRLIQQENLSWVVRMEGQHDCSSFTMPPSSLADVRALIDWQLNRAA